MHITIMGYYGQLYAYTLRRKTWMPKIIQPPKIETG